MDAMKELYEKVSKDIVLQEKLSSILKDAKKEEGNAVQEKLIAFAGDAGYDVTMEEAQSFFKDLAEKGDGELSSAEMDMVAGGKTVFTIALNVVTLGGLALFSAMETTLDCDNVNIPGKK